MTEHRQTFDIESEGRGTEGSVYSLEERMNLTEAVLGDLSSSTSSSTHRLGKGQQMHLDPRTNFSVVPVRLECHDISFIIDDFEILHELDCSFEPFKITAITGPAKAGKSSLLNVLYGRGRGHIVGDILANGEPLHARSALNSFNMIPQDDVLLPLLTPMEILTYASMLRLPPRLSEEDRDMRISAILGTMGLTRYADHQVNSFPTHNAAALRRRTSIAQELLTLPSVLFLDEPTANLDNKSAVDLLKLMKDLAHKRGMNVICAVYHVPAQCLNVFDKLLLLHHGEVVYEGSTPGCQAYMASLKQPVPTFHNPAVYYTDVLQSSGYLGINFIDEWAKRKAETRAQQTSSGDGIEKQETSGIIQDEELEGTTAEDFLQSGAIVGSGAGTAGSAGDSDGARQSRGSAGRNSPRNSRLSKDSGVAVRTSVDSAGYPQRSGDRKSKDRPRGLTGMRPVESEGEPAYPVSTWQQMSTLFRRATYITLKDRTQFSWRLAWSIGVALMVGLTFLDITDDQDSSRDRKSVMFTTIVFSLTTSVLTTATVFLFERHVVFREYFNGSYKMLSYYYARLATLWMFQAVYITAYCIITYSMIQLESGAHHFFIFLLTNILCAWLAATAGMIVGLLSIPFIYVVLMYSLMALSLLAGYMILPDNIPWYFKWLYYISPYQFAYQVLVVNEFEDLTFSWCYPHKGDFCPFGGGKVEGDEQLESLDFNEDHLPLYILLLMAYVAVTVAAGYYAIRHEARQMRT